MILKNNQSLIWSQKNRPEVGIEPGTFWIHKDMGTKAFNAVLPNLG